MRPFSKVSAMDFPLIVGLLGMRVSGYLAKGWKRAVHVVMASAIRGIAAASGPYAVNRKPKNSGAGGPVPLVTWGCSLLMLEMWIASGKSL